MEERPRLWHSHCLQWDGVAVLCFQILKVLMKEEGDRGSGLKLDCEK